jgi:hypothetical protein
MPLLLLHATVPLARPTPDDCDCGPRGRVCACAEVLQTLPSSRSSHLAVVDCRLSLQLSDCRRAHVTSLPRAPPSALRPHLPSKLLHPSLGLIFHVRSPLHSRTRLCSVWMLPAAVQLLDAAAIEQPKLYRGSVSGSVTVLVLGPAGPCPWRRARRP